MVSWGIERAFADNIMPTAKAMVSIALRDRVICRVILPALMGLDPFNLFCGILLRKSGHDNDADLLEADLERKIVNRSRVLRLDS